MSLKQKINGFVQTFLDSYFTVNDKCKYIHDPIWGSVQVYPHELALIDTPLFQRLRQIHQTGFVFATYPTAKHTRFEHSLGVMNLAGRIALKLKEKHESLITEETVQRVRLAALLHDLGHSAFSHTTEEIYMYCKDLKDLTQPGGEFEGKGAGEVLSYLIVTSQAFRDFFERVKSSCPLLKVASVDDFAPLILGRASDTNKIRQFEADIISSSFDADKLDYFPRDGRSAGLELALDVDRLLNCFDIAIVNKDSLARSIMVVNKGGFNAIQQLLFARATLFTTVYHHHKVRACDCMIKGAIECFTSTQTKFRQTATEPVGLTMDSAADYLYLTDIEFFAEARSYPQNDPKHRLIHDLLYRRLLKRTIIISTLTIEHMSGMDTEPATQETKAGYDSFYNLRKNPLELRNLAKDIYQSAQISCTPHEVWIDIPSTPSFDKAGNAYISLGTNKLVKLSDYIPVQQWMSTYRQYNAQSFLFGPSDTEQRVKLAVAARKILLERYKMTLKDDSLPEDIRQLVINAEASEVN